MKNARERMDVLAADREVGSYRGVAAICGCGLGICTARTGSGK